MADEQSTPEGTNVILFPGPAAELQATASKDDDLPPSEREILVSVMEEHLAGMEKAALILAHSIERQRALLNKLKAVEGWTWKTEAPSALFGEAVLFRDCKLRVDGPA